MKGIAFGSLVLAGLLFGSGVFWVGYGVYRQSLPQAEVCRHWPQAQGRICISGIPEDIAEASVGLLEGK